ncbi:hypothetical protein OGAPHI_001996 [Ogataea philodendri]|uniref:Secreted protein n=1 Tax=Ogataea philodendri TaxID=1378263 RepID=A0A9P8PAE1_9ASCO|nr:uncharacterized protein OGAPHI_001996 [Ogataea philodendri]KAH3668242.1 hypothetical protein OGAPHI_001996 [Ogataea philodendri]
MGSSPLLTHLRSCLIGLLVLRRDSVHGNHEVLKRSLRRLLLEWLTVHESVELIRLRHDNVSTTKNTEDTERPDPHSGNGNDVVPVLRPPSEQGEHSCNDINDEHSTRQLPRWHGRPEWTSGSGNENQPVLSQGDLQEQDTIDGTEVLDDTSLWQEHGGQGDPGSDSKNDTHNNGHTP